MISAFISKGIQAEKKQQVALDAVTANPVELPSLALLFDSIVVKSLLDTGAKRCYFSYSVYNKYYI